jgi:hypothetical protein
MAQHLIQLPMMVILSLSSIGFSGYVVGNWSPDGFLEVLLIHALLLFSFECAAQLFAVSFRNPLLGLLQIINLWFASFLFAGFLVPEGDVPWPLRLFASISPLKWATKAAIFAEFHESTFTGAVLADSPTGFTCHSSSVECYGVTGEQVLTTMKSTAFKHLETESELAKDCSVLIAIAAVFKVGYFAVATVRCRSGQSVKAPDASNRTNIPAVFGPRHHTEA